MQVEESPGEHAGGAADGVVPVDLAEHHVPRKDHQFGGGAALGRYRQAVAGGVGDQGGHQAIAVEMATVWDPAVQAVSTQVVHLVDVDGAREDRTDQSHGGGIGASHQHIENLVWVNVPVALQDDCQRAVLAKKLGRERLMGRQTGKFHVLDRVTIRPVSQIVQQRGGQQHLGGMTVDNFTEPGIASQLPDVAQRVVEDAQGVFESGVGCSGVDSRDQAQLGDLSESLKFGRVDQRADPWGERNVLLDGNPNDATSDLEIGQLGNVAVGVLHWSNYSWNSRRTPGRLNHSASW